MTCFPKKKTIPSPGLRRRRLRYLRGVWVVFWGHERPRWLKDLKPRESEVLLCCAWDNRSLVPAVDRKRTWRFAGLFTATWQPFLHLCGTISVGGNLWGSSVALCGDCCRSKMCVKKVARAKKRGVFQPKLVAPPPEQETKIGPVPGASIPQPRTGVPPCALWMHACRPPHLCLSCRATAPFSVHVKFRRSSA